MALDELRHEIDEADRILLDAIEKRIDVARRIGEYKRIIGKPVYDRDREASKLDSLERLAGAESRPYIRDLYAKIFEVTRSHEDKPLFGVLGQKLPHTYSPMIHHLLTDEYTYGIIEREPEELDKLFADKVYGGFNVTIPYKKEAAKRCDVLSDEASAIGAVNTVVFAPDGKTYGYNTDIFGFEYMLSRNDIDPKGKKCLILGTGGASAAVSYALNRMGAEVSFCSRTGEIDYDNVYEKCADVSLIVNCTPVGMYPEVDGKALELSKFNSCEAYADLIYNPSVTRLMEEAESLGLKTAGGLSMLVAQAYKASCFFKGEKAFEVTPESSKVIDEITDILTGRMKNIAFIGMPGCGKTSLGKHIARITGREFVDLDEAYIAEYGVKPSETIEAEGEDAFRQKETEIIKKILPGSGRIISCGGGVVTRDINKYYLKCNSRIVYVERPLESLDHKDRPLSAREGVEKLYEQRRENYESWSDVRLTIGAKESKYDFLDEAEDILRNEGII